MDGQVRRGLMRGITFLERAQHADGSFDSFSSPSQRSFRPAYTYRTIFTPALILNALADIPEAAAVRAPLAAWLLTQKSLAWSYNYWAADAPERQRFPYPDDLDDTFCTAIALRRHDPQAVGPAALGRIVRLLLATEQAVGGPYRTWLVSPRAAPKWQDVDIAVNCNIAYFLRLVAQPPDALRAFIDACVREGKLASPYYPHTFPVWYYAARVCRGQQAAVLRTAILRRRKHGHWGSPLRTALALSALQEIDGTPPDEAALLYLLDKQQPDGSWPAEAFCLDPSREGKRHYSGAAALTTALTIEALHRATSQAAGHHTTANWPDHTQHAIYNAVVRQASAEYKALPGIALRRSAAATLKHMVRGDHNREIILLPFFASRSFALGEPVPQPLLERLGLANLYGWTAYTIYDDLLDTAGDVRLLPLANANMRLSLAHFLGAAPHSRPYQRFVHDIFHRIDAANAWEAAHCRFIIHDARVALGQLPRFGRREQLAERSLGHALPAVALLAARGIPPDDPRARALLTALRHYLIARQLGDDLRDWQADLHAGCCTYVVAQLLRNAGVPHGTHSLASLIPRLQREFTQHTLPAVSHTILRHTASARQALAQSKLVLPDSPVSNLIDGIEARANQQLAEHSNAQQFLAAYRQPIAK